MCADYERGSVPRLSGVCVWSLAVFLFPREALCAQKNMHALVTGTAMFPWNSILMNPHFVIFSETVLFLHQIFLKGLMARMENWPTLVLGKFAAQHRTKTHILRPHLRFFFSFDALSLRGLVFLIGLKFLAFNLPAKARILQQIKPPKTMDIVLK